ncbi:MAG: hypothetical protein ACXWLM_10130 [Myxococcales bacterium]
MLFRLRLHPTPLGLAAGFVVIALWALLWAWFLIGLVRGAPEKQARQPGELPELARVVTPLDVDYFATEPV